MNNGEFPKVRGWIQVGPLRLEFSPEEEEQPPSSKPGEEEELKQKMNALLEGRRALDEQIRQLQNLIEKRREGRDGGH